MMFFYKMILATVSAAFLFSFNSVFAQEESFELSCPEEVEAQKVGEMILDADFSGMRSHFGDPKDCLKQENFPHIRVAQDSPQESIEGLSLYIMESDDYEVTNFEVVDEEVGLHRIYFEVKASRYDSDLDSTEDMQTYRDQMSYVFYPSESMRGSNGCGGMITSPERVYVKKSCAPKL